MRYVFLRIYSNDELRDFLSDMLESGWVLDRCRGNLLFFRKQRLRDARLCVISSECTGKTPEGDEQIDEHIRIALGQGWQLLCIGDIESVIPVRRRLYFYTRDPAAAATEPDEAIDFQYAYRAYRSTRRWVFLWTPLTAAALASMITFMLQNGPHAVLIWIGLALLAISAGAVPLFFSRRALYRHVTRSLPLPADSHRTLHRRESFMAAGLAALLLGAVLLLFF